MDLQSEEILAYIKETTKYRFMLIVDMKKKGYLSLKLPIGVNFSKLRPLPKAI